MMFEKLYSRRKLQLLLALLMGIAFGFLLQRSGVTRYGTIIGQLRLQDNTVLKVMLSAVVTGMAGIHVMRAGKLIKLHPKPGSLGSLIPGGILFGAGFALLGYCPGTLVAAAGQGSLDAAFAGVPGMLLGTWIYALIYPKLAKTILKRTYFGTVSIPEKLGVVPAILVPVVILILVLGMLVLELNGL